VTEFLSYETWPGADEVFCRFARRLADAVTVALANGRMISDHYVGEDCSCPLGTLGPNRFPVDRQASESWGIHHDDAWVFTWGFDSSVGFDGHPYFELGKLYRQRFVEAAE
jgi:hypothetical protein